MLTGRRSHLVQRRDCPGVSVPAFLPVILSRHVLDKPLYSLISQIEHTLLYLSGSSSGLIFHSIPFNVVQSIQLSDEPFHLSTILLLNTCFLVSMGVNRLSIIRNSIEKKTIIDYGLTQSIIVNCRDNMAISHTNLFQHKKNIKSVIYAINN